MTIEEEIKLLERKLELLKQIKELQDKLNTQPVYVPYPVYPTPTIPNPGPWWVNPVTCTSDNWSTTV